MAAYAFGRVNPGVNVGVANGLAELDGSALLPARRLPARGRLPLRRPRATISMHGGALVSLPRAGQTTFFFAVPVPDDAYAIRTIMANGVQVGGIDKTWAVQGIAYCPSTTMNDGMTPTGGGTWRWQTFNAAGADDDFVQDAGTAIGGAQTIPVSTTPLIAAGMRSARLYFSDWNMLSPLTPASGLVRYVFIRLMGPAQDFIGASVGSSGWTGVPAVNQGWDYSIRIGAGDYVTNPATALGTTGYTTTNPIFAVQFLMSRAGYCMVCGGDSQMSTDTTTQALNGFLAQTAIAMTNRSGIWFSPWATAWGGSLRGTNERQLATAIDAARPSIVFIQGWSGNDPSSTTADADANLARVQRLYQRALDAQAFPVVISPLPRSDNTGARLTAWQYARTRLLAMMAAGMNVIDISNLVGDVTTGLFRPGFSNDAIHPNDAGHAAIATAAADFLTPLV